MDSEEVETVEVPVALCEDSPDADALNECVPEVEPVAHALGERLDAIVAVVLALDTRD